MLKEFIEKIEDLSWKRIAVNGRELSPHKLYPILAPMPVELSVRTLGGLVDYFQEQGDDDHELAFVHVIDHQRASLVGPLVGVEEQRPCYVAANAYEIKHRFGVWMPLDEFVVYIQCGFVQDETTAAILRVIGNIVQGDEAEYADDGITQRVTARTGVTRRGVVDLPNPVTLRPFRTFPDIEQPASKFVLRIKAGQDGGQPSCLLAEADGGAWKNQAIASIKAFFTANNMKVVG